MSQYNVGGDKGFIAGADLVDGTIVKLSSGKVVAATAGTDVSIGVVVGNVKNGQTANVRLRSAEGTIKVLAGAAITAGQKVTAGASGKAASTSTATHEVLGIALEGAADGDLFEVMPSNSVL